MTTPWFRVHFRKNSILVEGEAELARIKARKVPKVVMVERASTYTCAECGKISAWTATWRWYGSWKDIDDGKAVIHLCSDLCQERFAQQQPQKKRPKTPRKRADTRIMPSEPKPFDVTDWRTLDKARSDADPRRFPMPEHPRLADLGKREGQCRWCGSRIKTAYAWQRSWHRRSKGDATDCQWEWMLHTDLDAQWWHLVERDGIGCALLGKGEGRWVSAGGYHDPQRQIGVTSIRWSEPLQVDHVIPLWKVAHLPPDERRAYFGPDNLWLLSEAAHRKKTALEAAERAAIARA